MVKAIIRADCLPKVRLVGFLEAKVISALSFVRNYMPIVVDLRPGATPVRNNIQYHGRHAWEFGTTSSAYETPRS